MIKILNSSLTRLGVIKNVISSDRNGRDQWREHT